MKALWHPRCNAIMSPPADGIGWIKCHCGLYAARWRDGATGLFEVASKTGDREARVLGFHNGYMLGGASQRTYSDIEWQTLWAQQRGLTAETYLFARRNSPLVILAPQESNDTFWVDWPPELD